MTEPDESRALLERMQEWNEQSPPTLIVPSDEEVTEQKRLAKEVLADLDALPTTDDPEEFAAYTHRGRRLVTAKSVSTLKRVVAWERGVVGLHEHGTTNTGPRIDVWERECGMRGQPWCALFQLHALRHAAHLPRSECPCRWAYTPYWYEDAQHHRYGATMHSWHGRKVGDFVLFNFGGPWVCQHVGLLLPHDKTLEGNTTLVQGGSEDNGGGVGIKSRHGAGVVACVRLHAIHF